MPFIYNELNILIRKRRYSRIIRRLFTDTEGTDNNNTIDDMDDDMEDNDMEDNDMEAENLTVDNCPALAALLSNGEDFEQSSDFASAYAGRLIEFDGRIDYCVHHGDYKTRFDYLVSAEDYDAEHQIGPSFKFENVNYYDLHTDLDTVSVGLNVHILAEVEEFDSNKGLFYLDPVAITGR